jgi:Right handed beta helix region
MKTFGCAAILLLCYVFPAHAQQVAVDCSTPPTTFRHTWYIDPVNGQTEAAMTAAGVKLPSTGSAPTSAQQGSAAHPWNSLQAVFNVTTPSVPGYTYPLLTTAPYNYWPVGGTGYKIATGPSAGPIEPGDEILLMSGNYGNISIAMYNTSIADPYFTMVAAAPGQTPVFASLFISGTNKWIFNGIKVQSLAAATIGNNYLIEINNYGQTHQTSDIVFENMTISSQDDIYGWTQAQWVANARNGFSAQSGAVGADTNCISMTASHITNVRYGVSLGSSRTIFSGNQIDHFGDDAIDYAASALTITKNYLHDAVDVGDGNHPDAMQGQNGVLAAGVTVNTNSYVLIDSNTIIRQVDPNLPFPNSLQGIDAFDGEYQYLTVTNNIVITSACWGIAFSSVEGGLIANNTVLFDTLLPSAVNCVPAVYVGSQTHQGPPSRGVAVRNNLANVIAVDNRCVDVEADHNVSLGQLSWYVNGVAVFYYEPGTYWNENIVATGGTAAEFQNFNPPGYYDVMLLSTAHAIGVGTASGAPAYDILGVTRADYPPTAGAYAAAPPVN